MNIYRALCVPLLFGAIVSHAAENAMVSLLQANAQLKSIAWKVKSNAEKLPTVIQMVKDNQVVLQSLPQDLTKISWWQFTATKLENLSKHLDTHNNFASQILGTVRDNIDDIQSIDQNSELFKVLAQYFKKWYENMLEIKRIITMKLKGAALQSALNLLQGAVVVNANALTKIVGGRFADEILKQNDPLIKEIKKA